MRSPAVTRTCFRRRLGTELLEDRTQPSFLNFAAHVPGFLDAPAGLGTAGTFTPPGHSDGHPGLALGLTEVVQFSTPDRAAVLDLILPLPAASAANPDVILIVFPGQGGGSSGSDSGGGGSSAGNSGSGSGATGGSSTASGNTATVGTGDDHSFTPTSLVRAVSGTQFTTGSPVPAAATGSAAAILLPPNAGAATTAAGTTALIALPPGLGTNAAGGAGTVSPATPGNGASSAVMPSTLPFSLAPPSFPAIEGPHGPLLAAVAPLPHVPVPVEPVTPVAPAPTPAGPVATTPVATAEGTAAATTTAASADQLAATPEEEATPSRWTWFGATALAVGGLYWAARRYVRARRGNFLFRRRLAALPLGTILSTDLERL